LNFLLQFAEPPHPSELAIRKRFERIGIGPGRSWDASKVDPALLSDIDVGIPDAKEALKAKLATTSNSNRLFGPRSLLKTDYLTRDVAEAKSNWLPAPEGPYVIVARVYGPKPELIEGKSALPPLVSP
jgi:hypothetical protein